MAVVARVLVVSFLTAGFGVFLGGALFGGTDAGAVLAVLLGCVGAMIGAVAGAAREIVAAQRRKPEW